MFVSVIHRISKPDDFAERGEELTSAAPPEVKPLQFFPSTDGSKAVCLWEADSIEAARDYIDGTLGDASAQDYFAIEERYATGLPVRA